MLESLGALQQEAHESPVSSFPDESERKQEKKNHQVVLIEENPKTLSLEMTILSCKKQAEKIYGVWQQIRVATKILKHPKTL